MTNHSRRRGGFTLIELLVVMSIIGILIALLLPAVQMSRENGRRVLCVRNLTQLGLALHHYEASYEAFPPGVVDQPKAPIVDHIIGYHFGWIPQILPYLEEQNMYHSLNFDVSVYDISNITMRSMSLQMLACPSSPTPRQVIWSDDQRLGVPSGTTIGMGSGRYDDVMSDYAACHHGAETPIAGDNNGMFYLNSSLRLEDVADGLAHTIFAGEVNRKQDYTLGWTSGTRATLRNTGHRINQPVPAPLPSVLWVGGFGSYHTAGGANFLLGDGSVRFIKETVNRDVYRKLGHRHDGEVVDASSY